jgi:hypothetical protein
MISILDQASTVSPNAFRAVSRAAADGAAQSACSPAARADVAR